MSSEQAAPETRGVAVRMITAVDRGPVHDHRGRPGIVYILQGTITDHRNGVSTDHGPGVGWPVDRNNMHGLENRGTIPAVEIAVATDVPGTARAAP